MTPQQKKVFSILLFLGFIVFIIFWFPNSVGSDDPNMLSVFEPDESVQYTKTIPMIQPEETLSESIHNFIVYKHYFYGFPFFASSALVILPLRFMGQLNSTPLVMVLLRQLISVLPMLLSILVLVYIQTRFKSTLKSIILFSFLLSIPAVVRNNLWWHPDSLVLLFLVLTIFFLDRDGLDFGKNFYWAAVACGLAVGTKLLGLFLFAAIPTYIAWGYFTRRITAKRAIIAAGQFVAIMFAVTVISNPYLLSLQGRRAYYQTLSYQAEAMSFGWQVAYAKGPASWFNIIVEYYGEWIFIGISLAVLLAGCIRGPRRLLNVLILTWIVPLSVYILYFVAIKPAHFFLPIALPLYSSLSNIFPYLGGDNNQPSFSLPKYKRVAQILASGMVLIASWQFIINLQWDVAHYVDKLNREKTSASINFFSEVENHVLSQVPEGAKLHIYRDIRVYVPNTPGWEVTFYHKLLDIGYFQELNPQLILLSQQRIWDYTDPENVANAENPVKMASAFAFYSSADNGMVEGYRLVFRNEYGLAFVREDIYQKYFLDP